MSQMLAYLGGTKALAIEDTNSETTIHIYFCGSDFKLNHTPYPEGQEFKEEYITDVRDIRGDIDEFIEKGKYVVLGGGEPLLQRAPFVYLCSYIHSQGGKVELETNGSKPAVLKEALEKGMVDRVTFLMHAPFKPEQFQKVTQSGTFFKAAEEVIKEIKKSLVLLKAYQDKVEIRFRTVIVPSLMFKKEDLLEIAYELEGIDSRWELVPYSSQGVSNKKYSGLNSPSIEFLNTLREEILKEYSNMRVDIEENRVISVNSRADSESDEDMT